MNIFFLYLWHCYSAGNLYIIITLNGRVGGSFNVVWPCGSKSSWRHCALYPSICAVTRRCLSYDWERSVTWTRDLGPVPARHSHAFTAEACNNDNNNKKNIIVLWFRYLCVHFFHGARAASQYRVIPRVYRGMLTAVLLAKRRIKKWCYFVNMPI